VQQEDEIDGEERRLFDLDEANYTSFTPKRSHNKMAICREEAFKNLRRNKESTDKTKPSAPDGELHVIPEDFLKFPVWSNPGKEAENEVRKKR
jgi:hypothetical protein